MKICPKCGREFERLLALSRIDNKTMIRDECGTKSKEIKSCEVNCNG